MRALIATEGSSDIGFGHLTRCTSLYQAFDKIGAATEFIVNGDKAVYDLLKGTNHIVFNWLKELERFYDLLKETEIAIIDSYLADHDIYKRISDSVNVAVYIDDNRRMDYPDGIVVNGTIFAEEMDYPKREGIIYLLGSRYIPMRREFWEIQERKIKKDIEIIMITFGGDDSKNMTPKVLKLLADNHPELTKNVIIGKGFQDINALEKIKDKNTKLIYYPNADGMKNAMVESDIAISAGGQTLYELARVDLPTIAIAVADNQLNNIKGLQKAGFIEYAGWWKEEGVLNNILQKIQLLKNSGSREEKIKIGKKLVDGKGAIRIAEYCIKRYYAQNLFLRRAEKRDVYNVYELSNEPKIRNNSFSQEQIGIDSHKKWFFDKLNDKSCLFLIAEVNNNFLGQVRFDINDVESVISISIEKKHRGLGAGGVLIQKAIDSLRLKNPDIRHIKAFIKRENIASVRFFEKADFKFKKKLKVKNQDALEYQYQL